MMPPMDSETSAATTTGGVPWWRGFFKDWAGLSTIGGAAAGVAIGLWAAHTRSLLGDEKDVLIGVLGASVGVLAVALTAMTLVIVFLTDKFLGRLIRDLDVHRFFGPFVAVSIVSGAAAIVSLVGAIDSATKAERPKDILFGLSAGLLTWAVLGAVRLVFVLRKWATTMETDGGDDDQSSEKQTSALVDIRQILTSLLETVQRERPSR
jgi:hypothetical protein